jgi:hypothetical protein
VVWALPTPKLTTSVFLADFPGIKIKEYSQRVSKKDGKYLGSQITFKIIIKGH